MSKTDDLEQKIDFLTSSRRGATGTKHMGYLIAVVDRPCLMHACPKRAYAARSMPVNWNISKNILQIQRLQVSADDISEISG